MHKNGRKWPCLVVFCKKPALHQGKQRLAKTVGAEVALKFAQLFLKCAVEDAHDWPGPVIISPASIEDKNWAGTLLVRDHIVMPQPEGGLGHRLQTIDLKARAQGYEKVIFIGSDLPGLRLDHYQQAMTSLGPSDIILSPATDGGVTIMGACRPWPGLAQLPWSTDSLGRELEQLCLKAGLTVKKISPSFDVDVAQDLKTLWQEIKDDTRPARRQLWGYLNDFLKQEMVNYG